MDNDYDYPVLRMKRSARFSRQSKIKLHSSYNIHMKSLCSTRYNIDHSELYRNICDINAYYAFTVHTGSLCIHVLGA